jgi:hypothetical protein
MNRQRWWILQMLDVTTAILGNMAPRTLVQTMLALQRIAILYADCANAFADYSDEDGSVKLLLEEDRERYHTVLSGNRTVAKVRRKAELPGRG